MNAIAAEFDIDQLVEHHLPAARRGDGDAYARIVGACQNSITAIALAIVRDVATSEDIAQEAFLKAWQGLDTLKNQASFLPWLRQITRNLARDYLRATRAQPMTGSGAEMAINMAADPSPSPAERLLRTEQEQAAADIISSLPEDSRETLLLFYREGQRSRQVAALLGLSDAAVRKRLSRARELVRGEMLERFGEFARGSAPGAAFTAVVIGSLAVASPAASAAAVIGSGLVGSGLGKLGSGAIAGSSVSGGVAGGTMAVVANAAWLDADTLAMAALGGLGGLFGAAATLWYLLRLAQTPGERQQVLRFMRLNTVTGALWGGAMVLVFTLLPQWWSLPIVFLAGMGLINYQYLVMLPRIMDPILAYPVNQRRRRCYEYTLGRTAVLYSSLLATAVIAIAVVRSSDFPI